MDGVAPKICVVSIYHGSTGWKILGKEIPEPHPLQVSFTHPRSERMAVDATDGNNTIYFLERLALVVVCANVMGVTGTSSRETMIPWTHLGALTRLLLSLQVLSDTAV